MASLPTNSNDSPRVDSDYDATITAQRSGSVNENPSGEEFVKQSQKKPVDTPERQYRNIITRNDENARLKAIEAQTGSLPGSKEGSRPRNMSNPGVVTPKDDNRQLENLDSRLANVERCLHRISDALRNLNAASAGGNDGVPFSKNTNAPARRNPPVKNKEKYNKRKP